MLKAIYLNQKKIPVPVPIQTLSEALCWAESTLLPADRIITKVILDGDVHYDVLNDPSLSSLPLKAESKLHLQVDSAMDLSLQTLDAMRNLGVVLERNLKPMAVALWQAMPKNEPGGLKDLVGDIELCNAMLDHLMGLLDHGLSERFLRAAELITTASVALVGRYPQSDWKGMARVLLNHYEPALLMLTAELGSLQREMFEARSDPRCQVAKAL
jgi:hypothetical protein